MIPSIAIIVPFRLQKGQNRQNELDMFVPFMIKYLSTLKDRGHIKKFHIYVIKQTGTYEDKNIKFNRGLLLNVGTQLVHETYDVFIFHDVDLLPCNSLINYYAVEPSVPIHIAGCWDRYNSNRNYFGGIVSFCRRDFNIINGFPNDFWGWGGEDDALLHRCKVNDITPYKVDKGYISDIENDTGYKLGEKLDILRINKEWKCLDKWEQLYRDRSSWKKNGLRQVYDRYKVINSEKLDDLSIIEVDIH